jgi:putative MATE family efflux protein
VRKNPGRRDLTQGGLAANIWHLALPLLISGTLQDLFNIVDMIFVGRLGPSAIAAVSMSGVVMGLIRMLAMGISTGTVALVSRFVGQKDERAAEDAVGQSLLLGLLGSAAVALFGWLLSGPVLRLLGAADDVIAPGVAYLRIMCVGSFTMFLTMILSAGARGFGDAVTPMLALGIASVLNVGLDPLLIFGIGPFPRMGTAGAALATVASRGVGAVVLLRPLFRGGRRPRLLPAAGKRYLGRLLSIGSYSSLRMLSMNASRLALVRIVSPFGTFALAAFGIGLRLRIFAITLGFSLADATAVVVGQNLGAGRPERAERSAWISVLFFGLIAGLLALVFLAAPAAVIGLFNRHPEVLALGVRYLYFFAAALLLLDFAVVLGRAMDGAGDTAASMVVTFIALIAVGIPAAWGFSRLWGVNGVWAAMTAGDILQGLGMIACFRMGRWKRKAV